MPSFASLCTIGVAAVLLPAKNVGAFLIMSPTYLPKSQALTAAWNNHDGSSSTTTSQLGASSSSGAAPARAATAEEAKDILRHELEASKGSTLGDDVLAAAEVKD